MDTIPRDRIEADEQARDRQSASLAALAALLILLVAGLFLIHALRREASVATCLTAGRADCGALVSGSRQLAI